MKKTLIVVLISFFTLMANSQPVAETFDYQYTTLPNGRVLEMNADYVLYFLSDMVGRVPLWSYEPHQLYLNDIEGAEFFSFGNSVYLVSYGGTTIENRRTIIQKFSFEGDLLNQVQIPNEWNHVSFMQVASDRIVTNSHDSLYLFTSGLQLEKRVKGPDERINDFDVHNGHIYALVENSDVSEYFIVEYDSELDSIDSKQILLNSAGYTCTAMRIGLNNAGEVFVHEYWNIDPPTDPKIVLRKFDASMNEIWESPSDTSYLDPGVFAPLDDGGILVSNKDMAGNRISRIDASGEWSVLLEGWIGVDYESDSSYTFVDANSGGYHFSKKGDFIPWYYKVFIEHVSWYNPSGALCMPDPEKGIMIQLDAGYWPTEGGVTWSDGVNENPHIVYSPGAYYANFNFNGNVGYTDTFMVEDHYILVDKPKFDLDYNGILSICEGTSLEVTVMVHNDNGTDYTYEIENFGIFDQTISLNQERSYKFIVTDGYGCFSDTAIELTIKKPYSEGICMVTVDPVTEKNMIVWNKTLGQGTVNYTIARGFGQTEIGSKEFQGENYLVDQTSDPAIQAYRYFITTTDTCNNSIMSEISHKTLHLTANVGTSGEVNLIWEPYIGVDVYQYNFYRSTDGENYELIGAMEYDPVISQYSDYEHPFWRLFYKIGIVGNFSCELETTKKSIMGQAGEIFSNAKLIYTTGVDASDMEQKMVVYPNPVKQNIFVKILNPGDRFLNLRIINQVGSVLLETTFKGEELTLDLPGGIPPGLYYLSVSGFENEIPATRKIIIAR